MKITLKERVFERVINMSGTVRTVPDATFVFYTV